jgi:CRP-like cAMP-binding protein
VRVDREISAALRRVCPYRLVVEEDLRQLQQEITLREAAAGETLFTEGDPTTGVAAVLEGQVDVRRHDRTLVTLGPGSVLGELSLFLPAARRTASAIASTPLRMVFWPASDLPARLTAHERLATAIVADLAHVLADRLERRTQDVVELLDVAGRRLPLSDLERLRRRAVE